MKSKITLTVFGSTGVIGKNTMAIVRLNPQDFDVIALTGWNSVSLLIEQCHEFHPKYVVCSEKAYLQLKGQISDSISILTGKKGLIDVAQQDVDVMVGGMVGTSALSVLKEAVKHTKKLCLANKESIICGGDLFLDLVSISGTKLVPVDSEHSALYQLLEYPSFVSSMALIASGGPFYNKSIDFASVTHKDVLNHPVWDLGFKVATDSALLTNKALELAEAQYLFHINPDKIQVYIHPQGMIHGGISFHDGVTLWQTHVPDMKVPIAYALYWPERTDLIHPHHKPFIQPVDLTQISKWHMDPVKEPFNEPLKLMREALKAGHGSVIVYNIADEVAVRNFQLGTLGFHQIVPFIHKALNKIEVPTDFDSIDHILEFCATTEIKLGTLT